MNDALALTLAVAVPLRIAELAQLDNDHRARVVTRWAADAVDQVAHRGDVLQFRTKQRGATADVFNHLARGLAALAHSPGGVLFAGVHWCATDHPGGLECASIAALPCGHDTEEGT